MWRRFLIGWAVVFVLFLIGWYEAALWHECRQTNSVLYCTRLITR